MVQKRLFQDQVMQSLELPSQDAPVTIPALGDAGKCALEQRRKQQDSQIPCIEGELHGCGAGLIAQVFCKSSLQLKEAIDPQARAAQVPISHFSLKTEGAKSNLKSICPSTCRSRWACPHPPPHDLTHAFRTVSCCGCHHSWDRSDNNGRPVGVSRTAGVSN